MEPRDKAEVSRNCSHLPKIVAEADGPVPLRAGDDALPGAEDRQAGGPVLPLPREHGVPHRDSLLPVLLVRPLLVTLLPFLVFAHYFWAG